MGELNLRDMAIELLSIDRNFYNYVKEPYKTRISDFELYTFVQMWGNTSGGFEGIGGSAMTNQRTYVFVPVPNIGKENCLVFFGGRFAYCVPYSEKFMKDVINQDVAGVHEKWKYRLQ